MPLHDFRPLFAHFPAVLDEMPTEFSSHRFILCLAQQQQALYVEALCAYRSTQNRQRAAPFQIVHGQLARRLRALRNLVAYVGETPSTDIFGHSNGCARWRKVPQS